MKTSEPTRAFAGFAGVIALSIVACSGSGSVRTSLVVQIDSSWTGDTLTLIHNGSFPVTDTLVLDLEIRGWEDEEGSFFGDIQEIEPTPDGGVLVFDYIGKQLFRFDSDGRLMHRVGGPGQGPGEYLGVNGLAALPDGRVLVRAPRHITVYSETGEYLNDWPFRLDFASDEMLRASWDGSVAVKLNLTDVRDTWRRADVGFIRLSPEGAVLDTVVPPPTPWDGEMVSAQSVYPRKHTAWSPEGYPVTGVSSRLAFQFRRADGAFVRSEFPIEPVPFRSDKRAQWEAEMEHLRRTAPMFAPQLPPVPDLKPVFRQLLTSNTGEIWLRLSTISDADVLDAVSTFPPQFAEPGHTFRPLWKEPLLFAAFGVDGRFKRSIKGESVQEVQAIVGDTVWAIQTGPLGEGSVVRLLVRPLSARAGSIR